MYCNGGIYPDNVKLIEAFGGRGERLCNAGDHAPPLSYRSGDTASGKKISQGMLVFGELPQAGLDDTLSPIKEPVDL